MNYNETTGYWEAYIKVTSDTNLIIVAKDSIRETRITLSIKVKTNQGQTSNNNNNNNTETGTSNDKKQDPTILGVPIQVLTITATLLATFIIATAIILKKRAAREIIQTVNQATAISKNLNEEIELEDEI